MLAAALAASACASTSVLHEFTTDGCSLFPDGDGVAPQRWRDCCVNHDVAYWRGGSVNERQRADSGLRACVLERSGRPALATLMYCGVRLGGTPWLPTGFRWAYGWGYGRGYAALTTDERQQAAQKLAAYPLACCQKQ